MGKGARAGAGEAGGAGLAAGGAGGAGSAAGGAARGPREDPAFILATCNLTVGTLPCRCSLARGAPDEGGSGSTPESTSLAGGRAPDAPPPCSSLAGGRASDNEECCSSPASAREGSCCCGSAGPGRGRLKPGVDGGNPASDQPEEEGDWIPPPSSWILPKLPSSSRPLKRPPSGVLTDSCELPPSLSQAVTALYGCTGAAAWGGSPASRPPYGCTGAPPASSSPPPPPCSSCSTGMAGTGGAARRRLAARGSASSECLRGLST
jgi:hypothetical protein